MLLAFFISFAQIIFILFKGYFLSIEFTLYPYLVGHRFIPYTNILDQHFPSLFFGVFSLPLLSQTSPTPLLILFVLVILSTNLLFYRYLKLAKIQKPLLWLVLYVTLMSYFSVNILWVETFINFLMVVTLNLSLKKAKVSNLIIGLILSQILLMRPTLLPCLFFLLLFIGGFTTEIFFGLLSGLIISFLYLIFKNNFQQFIGLAINFNFSSYAKGSNNTPALRQIFIITALLIYSLYNSLKSKNLYLLSAVFFSLFAIFPRFGFEHLQPFILFTVLLASISKAKKPIIELILIGVFAILLTIGLVRNRYGNYFYQPHLYSLANEISKLPGREVYLFGASDLLYPLSNKIPVGNLYLPSLPWYLNYPEFKEKLFERLKDSDAPIIVDTNFEVDGRKLIYSAPKIYEYIKMNYNLVEANGGIELFLKKL